jgi:hypothetical protein
VAGALTISEQCGDLVGASIDAPEAHYGVIQEGQDELLPFTPRPPS